MIILPMNPTAEVLRRLDLTAFKESDFQSLVVRALRHSYSNYKCVPFTGTFQLEEISRQPDLALVAADFSHWFVVEVELSRHSLSSHVLPQVRAFAFGQPKDDCARALSRELHISVERAQTLLQYVPRAVAVVVDEWNDSWLAQLSALGCQLMEIAAYGSDTEDLAFSIRGSLHVVEENIGFGRYFATDRSIRFSKAARLPLGTAQLVDTAGRSTSWAVSRDSDSIWLTCVGHPLNLTDNAYVQIKRTVDGAFRLVVPAD